MLLKHIWSGLVSTKSRSLTTTGEYEPQHQPWCPVSYSPGSFVHFQFVAVIFCKKKPFRPLFHFKSQYPSSREVGSLHFRFRRHLRGRRFRGRRCGRGSVVFGCRFAAQANQAAVATGNLFFFVLGIDAQGFQNLDDGMIEPCIYMGMLKCLLQICRGSVFFFGFSSLGRSATASFFVSFLAASFTGGFFAASLLVAALGNSSISSWDSLVDPPKSIAAKAEILISLQFLCTWSDTNLLIDWAALGLPSCFTSRQTRNPRLCEKTQFYVQKHRSIMVGCLIMDNLMPPFFVAILVGHLGQKFRSCCSYQGTATGKIGCHSCEEILATLISI